MIACIVKRNGETEMRSKKMMIILATLSALETTPIEKKLIGEGKTLNIKASDISFWSNCNRMTTYRNLQKLEKLGIIEHRQEPYKNTVINFWGTTEKGKQFYLNQKAMF